MREGGINIISSWIDQFEVGATPCVQELAVKCIVEPAKADYTILYTEPGDYLKFSLVEVGSALAANKTILVVGDGPSVSRVMIKHPNIFHVQTIDEAFAKIDELATESGV